MEREANKEPGNMFAPGRLSTDDLKHGINLLVTRGVTRPAVASDFSWITTTRDTILGWVEGNSAIDYIRQSTPSQYLTKTARGWFDEDQDGKISNDDFLLSYQRRMVRLEAHRPTLDYYLPFVGQCMFGLTCGWIVGTVARRTYEAMFWIIAFGGAGYYGYQYLAEQQIINKEVVRNHAMGAVKNALDVNKDGELSKADVDAFVEKKLSIVDQKLGPGGFAPGITGGVTFGLGVIKGLRWI